MRLKKLQIAGFKSFVDPTDIRLPADFVAVVGPNGCGKSNVIDAVRWVMGESSAKMLRGDNMTDVIFNGSSVRKPVGKAAVELLFDNSDGAVGGSFSGFAEIAIKRTLSRDGNSKYYINRILARRKDVLDLFRGTGLGPRSYSVIEQGMVSRIIEARPDDLRLFVEEAAGTSKYKERRRETETRIGHTRENLERVSDIRDELGKRLRSLKRQARAAKRHQDLRAEERAVAGQLQMLRLAALNAELEQQDRLGAQYQNVLEKATATQRGTEAETETWRQQHGEAQEKHNEVHLAEIQLETAINGVEQRMEDLRATRQRQSGEQERLRAERAEQSQQLAKDQARLTQLQTEHSTLAPELAQLKQDRQLADERLADAEIELENWQETWDSFAEESQTPARQQEVQQSRITQLEQHIQRATDQRARRNEELAALRAQLAATNLAAIRAEVAAHDVACERGEQEMQQIEEALQGLQNAVQLKRDEGMALRAQQNEARSRRSSLQQIQAATLGGDDATLQRWFVESGLGQQPKLASRIRVADGWERAVDRLMNGFLGAVCVHPLPDGVLTEHPDCAFTLVNDAAPAKQNPGSDKNPGKGSGKSKGLLDQVDGGETDLSGFLGGVYVAESVEQAVAMQPTLGNRDCVVTRDGVLVGSNWVSFASKSQLETGVLVREEEMKQLQNRLDALEKQVAAVDEDIASQEQAREAQRRKGKQQRATLNRLQQEKTERHSALSRQDARHLEAEQRCAALETEIRSLGEHADNDHTEITAAQSLLQRAADQRGALQSQRDDLLEQKEAHQRALASRKAALQEAQSQAHQRELQQQRLDADLASTADGITRLEYQLRGADEQLAQIDDALGQAGDPVGELETQLQEMLQQQVEIQRSRAESSDALAALDDGIRRLKAQHAEQVVAVSTAQEMLNQHQSQQGEVVGRRDLRREDIEREGHDQQALEAQLPGTATIEEWEQKIAALQGKIHRIGVVNLVAIDEFSEESERKEHLDQQYADLTEALEILQNVIRKIDRETRSRFKETFDQLNAGFNDFFPKLFGGGKAELRLTSDDFLTTGVVVMAQPPGKRNSHIHLLSGGEKALAAVALMFALFKLNPAPFCMLDEVDAPLDDANVERYCTTLKTLVAVSQMIVITHNKITMEAADVLVGVTMSEPGVSRLVSVDVEQAVELAAQ